MRIEYTFIYRDTHLWIWNNIENLFLGDIYLHNLCIVTILSFHVIIFVLCLLFLMLVAYYYENNYEKKRQTRLWKQIVHFQWTLCIIGVINNIVCVGKYTRKESLKCPELAAIKLQRKFCINLFNFFLFYCGVAPYCSSICRFKVSRSFILIRLLYFCIQL